MGPPFSFDLVELVVFRPPAALPAHERARFLLLAAFAASGLLAFSWLARIPSVRDALGLSAAELGAILLVGSFGALATVFASATLVARFGSARVFAVGAVVVVVGFTLMGVGPALASRWLFGLGIVVNGIGGALLNLPMNVESTRIEQSYGRTVIPHFHAAFSAGAVGGSVLGAVGAATDVPVVVQFAVVGTLVGVLRLATLGAGLVMPGGPVPTRGHSARGGGLRKELAGWTEPATLLIGVVAFAAALSEGAANNWVALAFVDGFGATEAFGAIVLGVFIGSMTIMRVIGTRAIDRMGRVATLQLSAALAIFGLALFGLASQPQVAILGVAFWGAGTALCFPIGVAAVSDDPHRAPARVSVIASLGSVAALTAAPVVGIIASALGGARHALLVVLLVLVAALVASRRVGPSLSAVADPREVLDAESLAA
jgi:predicted MFS family arabinose efflux permease